MALGSQKKFLWVSIRGHYVSSIGILVFADCGFGKYRRVIFFYQGISLEFL